MLDLISPKCRGGSSLTVFLSVLPQAFVSEYCVSVRPSARQSRQTDLVFLGRQWSRSPPGWCFGNFLRCDVTWKSPKWTCLCLASKYLDFVLFLPGIGYIVLYMASIVVTQQYFDKRRSMACGLIMCGYSVGVFLLPPLIRLSISMYGWQGALFILGALVLQAMVCGALLRPLSQEIMEMVILPEIQDGVRTNNETSVESVQPELHRDMTRQTNEKNNVESKSAYEYEKQGIGPGQDTQPTSVFLREMRHVSIENTTTTKPVPENCLQEPTSEPPPCRHLSLTMLIFGECLMQCGHRVTYQYTPLRCDLVGVSKLQAAWLLTIIGIVGCVMCPLAGWLGDRKFVNRTVMMGLSGALSGLTAVITTRLDKFQELIPLAVLFGIFDCT